AHVARIVTVNDRGGSGWARIGHRRDRHPRHDRHADRGYPRRHRRLSTLWGPALRVDHDRGAGDSRHFGGTFGAVMKRTFERIAVIAAMPSELQHLPGLPHLPQTS